MKTATRPPDRLWHGTTAAFDAFDARHLGAAVRNPTTQMGFFFSEDPEDAASWARRAQRLGIDKGPARLIEARLDIARPVPISEAKFRFYLQTARFSTIRRDLLAWRDAGHDGMTTIRGGARWWCAFDPGAIAITGSELLDAPDADPGPG
jgi:hypothetical protein